MNAAFTAYNRAGAGPPVVCLHGFGDTWRTWELVLPALAAHHDVLALTLAGHAGGPPLKSGAGTTSLVDAVERAMDEAGFSNAHLVGNSLGGWLAMQLASRGRARSVVAMAPAGGWAEGDRSRDELLRLQSRIFEFARGAALYAEEVVATPEGRRGSTELTVSNYEHIPVDLLAHRIRGAAGCVGAFEMIEAAHRETWSLAAEAVRCPVRIVWGTDDKLLPWPSSAVRFREEWMPHADWVELDGIGHCPQLDAPIVASELILGLTSC